MSSQYHIFELHISNHQSISLKFRFRVETCSAKKSPGHNVQNFYSDSGLDIYYIYKQYLSQYLNEKQFSLSSDLPSDFLGSKLLQKFNWNSKMNKNLALGQETRSLIKTVWDKAVGDLSDIFRFAEEDFFAAVSFDMINKAEAVLHKQKEELDKNDVGGKAAVDYSTELWSSLPFLDSIKTKKITDKRNLFMFFEIMQVIRDVISVSESTDWNLRASILSKYR